MVAPLAPNQTNPRPRLRLDQIGTPSTAADFFPADTSDAAVTRYREHLTKTGEPFLLLGSPETTPKLVTLADTLQQPFAPASLILLPESLYLQQGLIAMRQHHATIVGLVDEIGQMTGTLTLSDAVDAWLDTGPTNTQTIQHHDTHLILDGSTTLLDLNDLLPTPLQAPTRTINGYILTQIGRLPSVGECFELDGYTITILKTTLRRIQQLRLDLPESYPSPLSITQPSVSYARP